MSEPSFKLFKRGGRWFASKKYRTRGLVEVPCGDGSQKAAEEIARKAFEQRDQAAEAGRERWRRTRAAAEKAKAAQGPAASPPPPPPRPAEQPAEDEPTPIERPRPALPDPPPAEPMPAAAVTPERSEQIRLKLLALGDSRPIEPDSVHAPGEDPRTNDEPRNEEDVEADNEAGELIADMIAGAAVVGHAKFIASRLKKHKPPKRPGEANERMLQWERDGIKHNAAKLFGSSTRLGPTGKMFVGALLVTLGMYIDAEPIEVVPSTAGAAPSSEEPTNAAPQPAPAPPARAPAPSGGAGANVRELMPLGRFK